ncbi:MAG: hypothetical protein ABH815_00330 [Candidatus Omnitrophota bacterium]
MRCSRKITIGIMVLDALFYFVLPAFAVSAEKGGFVTLSRSEGRELVADEMVGLYRQPGEGDVSPVGIKSGTTVLVTETADIGNKRSYLVSTVGREGGMMGWVSEGYIFEITAASARE